MRRPTSWPGPLRRPEMRVILYAAVLVAVGGAMFWLLGSAGMLWADPEGIWCPPYPLLVLSAAFIVTEWSALHISVHQQTHTISMTTLPLVYGLMVTDVVTVTAARVAAGLGIAVLVRKSPVLKWMWNAALFFTETAVAATIIRFALDLQPPKDFLGWFALLGAALAAEAFSFFAVPFVIVLYEGRWRPELFSGPIVPHVLVAISNSFAVVAVAASLVNPMLLLFALVAVVGVVLFTRLHGGLSRRHGSLQRLHMFTTSLDVGTDASIVDAGLEHLTKTLNCRGAGVITVGQLGEVVGQVRVEDRVSAFDSPLTAAQLKALEGEHDSLVWRGARLDLQPLFVELDARQLLIASVMGETELPGLVFAFDRQGVTTDFQEDERTLFASLARTFGTRLSNQHYVTALAEQATRDTLTGLPNRREFERELKERLEHAGTGGAVAIVDLDRFKDINDTLGHQSGDHLLEEVARRVMDVARPGDVVARIGGDEMAMIIGGTTEAPVVEAYLEQFRVAIAEPYEVRNIKLSVAASVGYALWPEDGMGESDLVRRADMAMYEAKRSHQGVVRYQPGYDENTPRRLQLASDLRAACERGELDLRLQPKVRADTLELTGFEALCRYQHPEFKLIEAGELIELAERGGFLPQLTRTVIATAARHAAYLRSSLIDVPIAVNLTPGDILDETVPDHLEATTRDAGVPISALSCEIDQLVGFGSDELAASEVVIGRLRDLRVRIALDDFGTGAAPFMVLHHIAVDEIKLDQLFVADATRSEVAETLVRSTIELAHNLGLCCVAEGVEELTVMEMLQRLGCDELQGNLISAALQIDEVLPWVNRWDIRRLELQGSTLVPPDVT